jgi:hypothetical protein
VDTNRRSLARGGVLDGTKRLIVRELARPPFSRHNGEHGRRAQRSRSGLITPRKPNPGEACRARPCAVSTTEESRPEVQRRATHPSAAPKAQLSSAPLGWRPLRRPFSMSESLSWSANRIAVVADPEEDRCESSSARLGGRSKASHRVRDVRIFGSSRRWSARAAGSQISRWDPSRFSGGSSFSKAAAAPQVSMKCVLAWENRLSFRAR